MGSSVSSAIPQTTIRENSAASVVKVYGLTVPVVRRAFRSTRSFVPTVVKMSLKKPVKQSKEQEQDWKKEESITSNTTMMPPLLN